MVPRIKEQARTTPQTMRIKMSILRLSIKPSYLVKSRFDLYWYEKFTPELDSTFRVVAGMWPEVVWKLIEVDSGTGLWDTAAENFQRECHARCSRNASG
jgi:hypothetical protein